MKIKRIGVFLMTTVLFAGLVGCRTEKKQTKPHVTLNIKTTSIALGTISGLGEPEIFDMFMAATEKFARQYDRYEVEFEISRYDYAEEKEQLADKYGTDGAADIFYAGSQNVPDYAANGWLVPLDDMIDDELRSDIYEKVWEQNSIGGKVYSLPYQQLQNTLLVNRTMMEDAGLGQYIPEEDTIARWSLEQFDAILQSLKESFTEEEIIPEDAENLQYSDCMSLFYKGQIAIVPGDLTDMKEARNSGVDAFPVNFPSPDGKGYCTSSINGFCIFDNGDEDRIQAAKDFIRFIYTEEELMQYTLGTIPVNRSVIEKHGKDIPILSAYEENMANSVDNIRNHQGWQGVRDVFYVNIQRLLQGSRTPEEVAQDIDQSCNDALGLTCGKEIPKKLRGG